MLTPTGTLGVAVWENLLDDRWAWEGELISTVRPRGPGGAAADGGRDVRPLRRGADLRAALEGAGFSDVTIERWTSTRRSRAPQAWWEWSWSGGARAFFEAMPEDAQERFRAAAFERLAGTGRDGLTRRFVAMLARARR